MSIRLFGEDAGQPVHEVTIRSKAGAEAKILSWGAVVRDLVVPSREGPQRVVLGLNSLEDYIAHSPHYGALAGRFANRIRNGRFTLDGETYQLDQNFLGKHGLHGGSAGFGKRPWQVAHNDENSVTLTLFSHDGDGGFPGNLTVTCRYSFVEPANLRTEITATTDKATIVNLALHSYYNLDGSADILDHIVQIPADFISTLDAELIPTGEIRSVTGTPFDFRTPRAVRFAGEGGDFFKYDQNFMLSTRGGPLRHAATVTSPKNGLSMEVHTTEPCIQFYDGVKMKPPVPGLGGVMYGARAGLCLEPQNVPDSPNVSHFPSPVLRPGEVYRQVTDYRFK